MTRGLKRAGAFAAVIAVLAMAGPPAAAEEGRVPLPDLAKAAKGDACVEPTEIMRRNHMDFLKTQRDETMHFGLRDGKYSLNGCIECHATADPGAPVPGVKTVELFCDQCHAYAAVTVDCWSCHNPRLAEQPTRTGRSFPASGEPAAIVGMLRAHLAKGNPTP